MLRRILLAPFALLYSMVLRLRHWLYDRSFLKSERSPIPTIVIGNLALGGTGKTPHVETMLRILEGTAPIATLSRGYGRKGIALREIRPNDRPEISGDEPLQLKLKFPSTRVFVGVDRVASIRSMRQLVPGLKAVVLDDAFQHRKLNASLNILLTRYDQPWNRDRLLPAGRLRDLPSRSSAAQIVIVTKCSSLPPHEQIQKWRSDLHLSAEQELFFSAIEYDRPRSIHGNDPMDLGNSPNVLLVTGIADPAPLVGHLKTFTSRIEHLAFPDHHYFASRDLRRLQDRWSRFAPDRKVLVTTEKDAVRLRPHIAAGELNGIPIAVIGMRAVILNDPDRFSALIREHVAKDPAHS